MASQASPTRPLEAEPSRRILLRWLIGLRWVMFAVLAVTLPAGERLLGFHVTYAIAVPAVALVGLVNLWMHRSHASGADWSPRAIALGVAFDVVAIAVVLAASGGAANPFSALFFVHVALAASLLPTRTTFALAGLAACAFASLFLLPSGACCPNHPANGAFSTHLYGMWLAFVLCAGLVSYFLTRVREALEAREAEIERLRARAAEGARFEALGTLAAGTAHELATPLGTISVLASEIAAGHASPDEARSHAERIALQVGRCREVISKMQAREGNEASFRGSAEIGPATIAAVAAWREAHPDALVSVRGETDPARTVPLAADEVEAALGVLLDNALHATRAAGRVDPIEVVFAAAPGGAVVRVEDAGVGVGRDLQGRLGEPFLTTKDPGQGMGMGLYLVRRMIEQIGGRLEVAAREPVGTSVSLYLAPAEG